MQTSSGIPLSKRQENEATLVKRIAIDSGWEIESINTLPDSTALEYKIRKAGEKATYGIRGYNVVPPSDQFLDDYIKAQFRSLGVPKAG